MVSIVETDCTRKAFYMGFQHIKVLADKVLREAELAARGHDGAHKFNGSGDGPTSQGGGKPLDPSPRLNAEGSASNVNGKRTGAETPASDARGIVRRTTASLEEVAFVASLTVVRDMAVARNARPSVRRAPVSATVIPMAAWKEAHAPIFPMTGIVVGR
jgi:hypothetical protein